MSTKKIVLTAVAIFAMAFALMAAQKVGEGEIPPGFDAVFNETFLAALASVIATTTIFKNMTGLKGTWAAVVAFIFAFAIAFIQYSALGVGYSLFLGLVAAILSSGAYKISTLIGNKWLIAIVPARFKANKKKKK